jgi:hypothetical protein
MNKNPPKRYREIGEDNRMVGVIRFYILPIRIMCYMPENRPN